MNEFIGRIRVLRFLASIFTGIWIAFLAVSIGSAQGDSPARPPRGSDKLRVATFNTALNREKPGQLAAEVRDQGSKAVARIAEVIQRIRPDVILLNEVDYDSAGDAIRGICDNYLAHGQNGQEPIEFPHRFVAEVNTGVDSGLDLNGDGKKNTPSDAFGFGAFPGQYGMVVLSRFPIGPHPRTFQRFLWRDMPGALWPLKPGSDEDFYKPEAKEVFRLSSKSHWDVPILVGERTLHLIAAHPTPPVFDGKEDRNGRRNHDEIRLIADYLGGEDYLYDDDNHRGGLPADASFVVLGDMNADPEDGDSYSHAAKQLIEHPRVNATAVPVSKGAKRAGATSRQVNEKQLGDPAADTGDFNDQSVGNLRLDFVLPSRDLRVVDSGVFWPAPDEPGADLADASDHHLVWMDIQF